MLLLCCLACYTSVVCFWFFFLGDTVPQMALTTQGFCGFKYISGLFFLSQSRMSFMEIILIGLFLGFFFLVIIYVCMGEYGFVHMNTVSAVSMEIRRRCLMPWN